MTIIIYVLTILLAIAVFLIIKNKRYRVVPFVSGVIFIFFIGCLLISLISLFVPHGEILMFPLGCIVLGVVVILAALNDFYSLVRCKDEIDGIYRGYNTYYGGNGISTQAPVFEYMYKATLYQEQTAQTISYKLLTKKCEMEKRIVFMLIRNIQQCSFFKKTESEFDHYSCFWDYVFFNRDNHIVRAISCILEIDSFLHGISQVALN